MTVRIINADVMDGLAQLSDESVHCVVTSPPYWGLRDYGTARWEGGEDECDHKGAPLISDKSGLAGYTSENVKLRTFSVPFRDICGKCGATRIDNQLGLETTLGEHIEAMVRVFREVRRVLRKDGTLWLNYGDCYVSAPPGRTKGDAFKTSSLAGMNTARVARQACQDRPTKQYLVDGLYDRKMDLQIGHGEDKNAIWGMKHKQHGLKPKDLCGVPWRVAFALQADGWWLRQDIIWSKPNPMPESIKDRCTKAHEYLFLLAKSERYFFDAEAIAEPALYDKGPGVVGRCKGPDHSPRAHSTNLRKDTHYQTGETTEQTTRNKRSVWEIATQPFPEAHFATFPPALIEPCIKAGTSERGCCAKCGASVKRITDTPDWYKDLDGHKMKSGDLKSGVNSGFGAKKDSVCRAYFTVGWEPTCKCDPSTIPCTVLDPFGGSGTTGLVSDRLKRNAILIELNPEYAAMAEKRIKGDCPMFASVSA